MRAFAEHWFGTVCADAGKGETKAQEFLKQLFREENKAIRELAITPILLSLTCAVFQQTGKFYSKRSKLYEEGLELLLVQWDKSRSVERDEIYRDLSVERKLELLSYVAVKKFEQQQYVLFEQVELEGYIAEFLGIGQRESRALLKAIEAQHGLLIERAQKVWSFSHLTFQEYFTAKHIYHYPQKIEALNKQHFLQNQLREVFLLVSEMIDIADDFILLMKTQISTCFNDPKLIALLQWADNTTRYTKGNYKPAAKRAIALGIACSIGAEISYNYECVSYNKETDKAIHCCEDIARNFNSIFPKLGSLYTPLAQELKKIQLLSTENFEKLINKMNLFELEHPPFDEEEDDQTLIHPIFNFMIDLWLETLNLDRELASFTDEKTDTVINYLKANLLIWECMKTANQVSCQTWKAIEESMLK